MMINAGYPLVTSLTCAVVQHLAALPQILEIKDVSPDLFESGEAQALYSELRSLVQLDRLRLTAAFSTDTW